MFKEEEFSIIVNLSKENEKKHIVLEYHFQKMQLHTLIQME